MSGTKLVTDMLAREPAYRIGWRRALDRALEEISKCPSLDENGYICEKSKAMQVILDLKAKG